MRKALLFQSNKETLSFIKDYKKCKSLWDQHHKDYTSKTKRKTSLEELGKRHDLNLQEVKNKIRTLRSYFAKEHQKVTKRKNDVSSSEEQHNIWFAYEPLRFIVDGIITRKMRENGAYFGETNVIEDSQQDGADNKTTVEQIKIDKKENETANDNNLKRKEETENEYDLFGKIVAIKLKKLNPQNRMLAQHRINNLLFDLEMEEITSNEAGRSTPDLKMNTSDDEESTQD